MSLETALFLVERDGVNHHVVGSKANEVMKPLDKVLVQRGENKYHAVYKKPESIQPWDSIADDDLLLAWENGQTKRVTGSQFKNLFVIFPPTDKVVLDIRFVSDLDNINRGLNSLGVEAVYPYIIGENGETQFLPDISPIESEKFQVPTVDMPSGYLFIGDPKTFAFGHSAANKLGIGMEFGPLTDTSLWENSDNICYNIHYCYGGLKYWNTSKFTSLKNLFYNTSNTKEVGGDVYETGHPYHEMMGWDTSNVTDFSYSFRRGIASIPDLKWDFSNAVTAKYMFSSNYGIPAWVENIEWGPNLIDLEWFGSGYGAQTPTNSLADNYYHGQKTPFDFSRWNVSNISSLPKGFMTSNLFYSDRIYNWVIQPRWGTTGSYFQNYNLLTLNSGPEDKQLLYDDYDIGIPKGPDLNGNPIVYPPNVNSGYSSTVNGTITFKTTTVNGNIITVSHDVTHYLLNPGSGVRYYSCKPRPTTEQVNLLQNGADVYLKIDY